MNPTQRGEENLKAIHDREADNADSGKARSDQASRTTNGEVAGGDRDDVPGGAYNVPPGMADEVSEEDAIKRRKSPEAER